MKKYLLLILSTILSLTGMAQSVSLDWVRTAGGAQYDMGHFVLTDKEDNVYTVGRFYGTVDFDPGTATQNLSSNGDYDVFVQKLDPSGNFIWAKSIGSSGFEWVHGAAIDSSNNIVFCGNFKNSMDVDPGTAVDTRIASGPQGDMYVVKLNEQGNFMWGHTMGDSVSDQFTAVDIDANNNVILGAIGFGSIDYDPGPGTSIVTGGASVIVQYAPNGNLNWAKAIHSTVPNNEPYIRDIEINNAGNILAIGNYFDTLDFDPGPAVFQMGSSINSGNLFILNLNNAGNFVWVKQLISDNYIESDEIETDNSGNIYIAGDFANNMDFDPDPIATFNVNGPGSAAFVVKLNASGNFVWGKKMGGTSGGWAHDKVDALKVDAAGDLIMCGYVSGTEDFDPGPGVAFISSTKPQGETDAFILKLSSTGNMIYVKDFGDTATEHALSLAIDQQGHFYVTGFFGNNNINQTPWHPTDFDPNAGVSSVLTNGFTDCYLSKFKNCTPSNSADVINNCGPYTWIDGNTYNLTNFTAKDTLTNLNGCDSVVTLNLTITNIDTSITISSDTLTSNETGASYLWISCENNLNLSNSNSQSYIPIVSGNYAVVITKNGCSDTSACKTFTSVGLTDYARKNSFSIYPNPAHQQLAIETAQAGTFNLMNQIGQAVYEVEIRKGINAIVLPEVAKGIYFYQFSDQKQILNRGKLLIVQ